MGFCGNHDAAVQAANLVSCYKAMGVELNELMKDVVIRIPGNENNGDVLRKLLPDKWGKSSTRCNVN